MKTINVVIKGENEHLAKFTLQDAINNNKQVVQNAKAALFKVKEGNKYILLVEVVGNSGQKYKLEITGATKASYPKPEQTLDAGRDLLMARITG